MTRKFLQMGYTRSRRYANYKGGRKRSRDSKPVEFGSGDRIKAEIAEIFGKLGFKSPMIQIIND